MYKVAVPLVNSVFQDSDQDYVLQMLKDFNAERVFISVGNYIVDPEKQDKEFENLQKTIAFLRKHHFEVGVWIWAFMINEQHTFTPLLTVDGQTVGHEICPFDEDFRRFSAQYMQRIASCSPDLIMFDDDFRYGFLGVPEPACLCEHHMEYIAKELGESVDFDTLSKHILLGEENRYRTAWLKANGEAMYGFCQTVRAAVDEINPRIRMGVCSCMSNWDVDGVSVEKIDRILAGGNRPFRRLIGAPYWATHQAWNNRLPNIIELNRMEMAWYTENEAELFGEADAYPRPRPNCPASFLELFDMALRADGTIHGILKYGMEYTSSPQYEPGYAMRHKKNRPIYAEIERRFSEKQAVGVRVYEYPEKIKRATLEKTGVIDNLFFSPASRMLSDNSIPTTYHGEGVYGIAFGENARYIPEEVLTRGIVLDAHAAKLLAARGIDVGAEWTGETKPVSLEYFTDQNEFTYCPVTAYAANLNPAARVIGRFGTERTNTVNGIPAAYLYENKDGQRFLVYTFDINYDQTEWAFRSYARSRQLAAAAEWLGGKCLPAYIDGNPDLYLMAKKSESAMAVGLWNCFADEVLEPMVQLDEKYTAVHPINCTARVEGDRVYLSDIAPYAFAGFEVTK